MPPPPIAIVAAHDAGFAPGVLVAGRYRLVRFIAEGGMGAVFEAEDTELGGSVAVKGILSAIAGDQRIVERFKREIRLARRITHPNVCRIFDLGHHAGRVFLTMELVRGETLAHRLKRRGRISTDQALPLAMQMASALDAAYGVGVVHRDFKSANVILVSAGDGETERVVVTDFGMARALAAGADAATLTSAGLGPGTPAYMAPEQVEGGRVGPAADIYSLGVVLYEMVTGKLPFSGETRFITAMKRLREPPQSPRTHVPDLDPRWERAILRCLARDPAARFASAAAVIRALRSQEVPEPGPSPRRGLRAGAPTHPRPSLAVLGFKSLSERAGVAWLSTALSEMLGTELAAGEQLRMIAGENVARAKMDLGLPEAEALARDTLARVRAHLGADLVVLGSYFAAGRRAGGELRLDLRVQDTAAGETVAALTERGTDSGLLELISRTGSRLRRTLGVKELSAAETGGVRASLPSTPEAARLYAEGLDKLRLFDSLGARTLLEKAVAAEPKYPLAHSALAEALSVLGYDGKARLEARKAYELSADLSREERLLVEGRYWEASKKWDKAVHIYRSLWNFFPDNLNYGLRLAEAQVAARTAKDALATVESLRGLPPPASADPRIDLAEADAADLLGDYRRCQRIAARAATKSTALSARVLVARARVRESFALRLLGQTRRAITATEEARRIFAEVGDRAGVATALHFFAIIRTTEGNLSGAKALFHEVLRIQRRIGHRLGMAKTLSNLGLVASQQGDWAGGRDRTEQALRIAREIDDGFVEAVLLTGLARVLSERGDMARAKNMYQESLAIYRKLGSRRDMAVTLNNLASDSVREGDLPRASSLYAEALKLFRETGDLSLVPLVLQGQGDVLAAKGALSRARRKYGRAIALAPKLGDRRWIADSQVLLAAVAIEEALPREAVRLARRALKELQKEGRRDWQALAHAVLARALLVNGKPREAMQAARKALALADKRSALDPRLSVAVTAARIRAASGRYNEAIRSLKKVISRARRAGLAGLQFEARLVLGETQVAQGQVDRGGSTLLALEQDAKAKGFGLIANKAAAARRSPTPTLAPTTRRLAPASLPGHLRVFTAAGSTPP